MQYLWIGQEWLGDDITAALVAAGILDTDQLLDRAALPDPQLVLCRELSITESRLQPALIFADLVRAKSIGPARAA